jgi:hypothetical protein
MHERTSTTMRLAHVISLPAQVSSSRDLVGLALVEMKHVCDA